MRQSRWRGRSPVLVLLLAGAMMRCRPSQEVDRAGGRWCVLVALVTAATLSSPTRPMDEAMDWVPVAPFILDDPIGALESYDPRGWTRAITFPPAGPFIKNLAGMSIDQLDYTVTASGKYPCELYRNATLKYGMNGAAEHFSTQDSHAIGNVFGRLQIGAPWSKTLSTNASI